MFVWEECCSLKHGQKLKNFVLSKQNRAIWWILSGTYLIKVMKIKFQFYRLNRPNCALWMNFIGGQGWYTVYYPPSQTQKGIYPKTTLYKFANLALQTNAKRTWGCASGGILSVRCNAGPAEELGKILKYRSNLRLYPVNFGNKLCILIFHYTFKLTKLFWPPLLRKTFLPLPLHLPSLHQSIYERSLRTGFFILNLTPAEINLSKTAPVCCSCVCSILACFVPLSFSFCLLASCFVFVQVVVFFFACSFLILFVFGNPFNLEHKMEKDLVWAHYSWGKFGFSGRIETPVYERSYSLLFGKLNVLFSSFRFIIENISGFENDLFIGRKNSGPPNPPFKITISVLKYISFNVKTSILWVEFEFLSYHYQNRENCRQKML